LYSVSINLIVERALLELVERHVELALALKREAQHAIALGDSKSDLALPRSVSRKRRVVNAR
jgi:hypothetical protein